MSLYVDLGTGHNWLAVDPSSKAGSDVDQPERPRTLPGIGEEGWPARLFSSRNARPGKALVGHAQ